MFSPRPRLPRLTSGVWLLALTAASFLAPWSGQQAFATTYFLNQSNTDSVFPDGTNYAKVDVSVDSSKKVTFDVTFTSNMTGYLFSKFGFNWVSPTNPSPDILSKISPPANWSVSGSGNQSEDGFGKFSYELKANNGINNAVSELKFTIDLSSSGLSASTIASNFEIDASGGSEGTAFFAAHVVPVGGPNGSLYIGGGPFVANPEPASIVSMGLAGGFLLPVFYRRMRRRLVD